jgi:hypothetical protein
MDREKQDECAWNSKLLIGRYGGHNGKLWFLGVGCMRSIPSQYKMKASKRLGATKEESNNSHNHA